MKARGSPERPGSPNNPSRKDEAVATKPRDDPPSSFRFGQRFGTFNGPDQDERPDSPKAKREGTSRSNNLIIF